MDKQEIAKLEKLFKGVANQTRISALILIYMNPGVTLDAIAKELKCNVKTMSEHTRRLKHADLITKTARGKTVQHRLTAYGTNVIGMMKKVLTFEQSK